MTREEAAAFPDALLPFLTVAETAELDQHLAALRDTLSALRGGICGKSNLLMAQFIWRVGRVNAICLAAEVRRGTM